MLQPPSLFRTSAVVAAAYDSLTLPLRCAPAPPADLVRRTRATAAGRHAMRRVLVQGCVLARPARPRSYRFSRVCRRLGAKLSLEHFVVSAGWPARSCGIRAHRARAHGHALARATCAHAHARLYVRTHAQALCTDRFASVQQTACARQRPTCNGQHAADNVHTKMCARSLSAPTDSRTCTARSAYRCRSTPRCRA